MRYRVLVVQKTGIYCVAMALKGNNVRREVYWKCACCQHGVIAWLDRGIFTSVPNCKICHRKVVVEDLGPSRDLFESLRRERMLREQYGHTLITGIYPDTLF